MKPSRLGFLTTVGVAAMGVTILTAPLANAQHPGPPGRYGCMMVGGTWTVYTGAYKGYAECCYRISSGKKLCDVYDPNGGFIGTGPGVVESPGAPLPPVATGSTPPVATRPIPASPSGPPPPSTNTGVKPPSTNTGTNEPPSVGAGANEPPPSAIQ